MNDHGPLARRLENRSSVLIRTPASSPSVTAACLDVLGGAEPAGRNVIVITSGPRPESFIDAWDEHIGVQPTDLRIIDLGTSMRSADTRESVDRRSLTPARNVVCGVNDLSDALAGLYDILNDCPPGNTQPVVFVDSLTALLRHVDRSELIEFVDDVAAAVRPVGGISYFRIEPNRHDGDTMALVTKVVDVTVRVTVDADGWTWSVLDYGSDGTESDPSLDTVFELLSDRRRRMILHWLRRTDGPVSIETLADWIVAREQDEARPVQDDAFERIYAGLYHVHLPMLEAAGAVTLDADRTSVAPGECAARIDPYLILAAGDDLGG